MTNNSSLQEWLIAFERAREKSVNLIIKFEKKIILELQSEKFNCSEPNKNYFINEENFKINKEEKYKEVVIKNKISKWLLFKLIIRQYSDFTSKIINQEKKDVNCISISFKRLDFDKSKGAPRLQINRILQQLPQSKRVNIENINIGSDKKLLLFIPYRSDLWVDSEYYWEDDCFIIDYYFMAILLILSPRIILKEIWHNKKILLTQIISDKQRNFGKILIATLASAVYNIIFDKLNCNRFLFLTSNSFITEVLRVFLLSLNVPIKLYEILHGIPTLEFYEYFDTVVNRVENNNKFHFIPQIKEFPSIEKYVNTLKIVSNLSINMAMNFYLLSCNDDKYQIKNTIKSELENLYTNSIQHGQLLIVFMGATSHDANFFDSKIYRVEKILIMLIQSYLSSKGKIYKIVYCPHPAHNYKEIQYKKYFEDNNILLFNESKLMWLIADAAIALYSSALFDAAYSGAEVFTPLRAEDDFYPESFLDLISHPGNDESCIFALERFLVDLISKPHGDHASNLDARLPRWIQLTQYSESSK